jgi:hypothetical protein
MISWFEFVYLSPGALLDIEFDRRVKTPIKTVIKVLISGNNASFVLRYCFWFNFHAGEKNLLKVHQQT